MAIHYASSENVQKFIDCYTQVFKSLYGILPDDYVKNQIETASGDDFFEKVDAALTNVNNIMLVSRENDKVNGMAWGNIREDGSSWLVFMGVISSSRGKGLGRSLLYRFIDESREKGAGKISLDTDPGLVPAINLYKSAGFVKEGTVMNPHGMELILYSKDLTTT